MTTAYITYINTHNPITNTWEDVPNNFVLVDDMGACVWYNYRDKTLRKHTPQGGVLKLIQREYPKYLEIGDIPASILQGLK